MTGSYAGYEYLQKVLSSLDSHVGCASRAALHDTTMRWNDSFILSGMDAGTQPPRRVWRFTPLLPLDGGSMEPGSLVDRTHNALSIGHVTIEGPAGAPLSCTLVFQGGHLANDDGQRSPSPSSTALPYGLWIVQEGAPPAPVLNCSDGQPRTWPPPANPLPPPHPRQSYE